MPKAKDMLATLDGEWIVSQELADVLSDPGLTGFSLLCVRHSADYSREPIEFAAVPSGQELLARAAAQDSALLDDEARFLRWAWLPEQRPLLSAAEQETMLVAKHRDKDAQAVRPWYQIVPNGPEIDINEQLARFGIDPFDDDPNGMYRCKVCGILGLNILSELFILAPTWRGADFARTRQLVGERFGRFVPRPLYVVSPRMRELLVSRNTQKVGFEVVHLT